MKEETTMMTTEMISNLSKIATRWTKGDMDRLYINIDAANELYISIESREHGQLTLNRRERGMGKIWIDVATGEIFTKGISDAEEVASEIAELIAYLCPSEETVEDTEETEVTSESTEITETYTVELCCDRFVEGQGFETNGSVFDTFDTDDVDGIDLEDALDTMDYVKHDLVDGEDYKIWVRVYNANGDEIQHIIDPIWESEL